MTSDRCRSVQQITGHRSPGCSLSTRLRQGTLLASPRRQGLPCSERLRSVRWGAAPAIDWTLAARTGLFDVDAANLSTEMVAAAAANAPWLTEVPFSECVPCGTPIGTVSAEAAERFGVSRGTALVAGAHDQLPPSSGGWQGGIGFDVRAGLQ